MRALTKKKLLLSKDTLVDLSDRLSEVRGGLSDICAQNSSLVATRFVTCSDLETRQGCVIEVVRSR